MKNNPPKESKPGSRTENTDLSKSTPNTNGETNSKENSEFKLFKLVDDTISETVEFLLRYLKTVLYLYLKPKKIFQAPNNTISFSRPYTFLAATILFYLYILHLEGLYDSPLFGNITNLSLQTSFVSIAPILAFTILSGIFFSYLINDSLRLGLISACYASSIFFINTLIFNFLTKTILFDVDQEGYEFFRYVDSSTNEVYSSSDLVLYLTLYLTYIALISFSPLRIMHSIKSRLSDITGVKKLYFHSIPFFFVIGLLYVASAHLVEPNFVKPEKRTVTFERAGYKLLDNKTKIELDLLITSTSNNTLIFSDRIDLSLRYFLNAEFITMQMREDAIIDPNYKTVNLEPKIKSWSANKDPFLVIEPNKKYWVVITAQFNNKTIDMLKHIKSRRFDLQGSFRMYGAEEVRRATFYLTDFIY